jgi:hypothetical protein
MPFEKGRQKTGGKKKGAVNRATQNAREAIAAFVDGNAHRLEGWLDRIASDDPAEAFRCFQSVVEYHIPKLARSEHTGMNGGPIQHTVTASDEEIIRQYTQHKGK